MRKGLIAAAVAAALGPMAVLADDISYSYVDLDYLSVNPEGAPSEDGFGLAGSFSIADNIHLFADYAGLDSLDQTSFGVGYHTNGDVSFFGNLSFVSLNPDGFPSEDGFGIEGGARGFFSDELEWQASVAYINVDSGDDTSFNLGVRYHINDMASVGVFAGFGDDSNQYGVGLRYSFD